MRALLQRVECASVKVDNKEVAKIDNGLVCFLGIHKSDNELKCAELAKKISNLRIFEDDQGKMNLSLMQIQAAVLVISQFTLYADCSSGNRPSFTEAMNWESAKKLYERFIAELQYLGCKTKSGVFGAKMNVLLNNYGPVTIMLEV